MKNYKNCKTIHNRKKRSKKKKPLSGELLVSKAQEMFEQMKKERFIRDMARSLDGLSVRIDLIGTPEASFVLAVENKRLKFFPHSMHTDIAVGIHKEYFLELLENPPDLYNVRYNNIIFRKGTVKLFKYAKPLLCSSIMLCGKLTALMQKNKLPKGRSNKL